MKSFGIQDSDSMMRFDDEPKQSVEYQKYITDTDYMLLDMYQSLSAWTPKVSMDSVAILGRKQMFLKDNYDIDEKHRFWNANLMPMIGINLS